MRTTRKRFPKGFPMTITRTLLASLAFSLGLGFSGAASAQTEGLTGDLKDATGAIIGRVDVTAAPKGVIVRIAVNGLTPGWHGAHFHAKGDCGDAKFLNSGGHVHGGEGASVHGLLNPAANDTGDLPNIFAGTDGKVVAEVYSPLVTLPTLKDADGTALVIHAAADDHLTQPIGGAGARVACAVLK
jgi:superoxide dismutase, Cu-Zn family